MKISTASSAASILSGIRLNRISDRDAKAALLKDYLALRKAAKGAEEDKNEIIRKFQEDWADELAAVQSFREKNRPVIGHLDYLEAEKDANKAISAIFSAEVDIDLVPVKMDAVADFSEDITLEQIAFLQEVGLIKE